MPYSGWRPNGLNEQDVPESIRNPHTHNHPPNTKNLPAEYWKTENEKKREQAFQKFIKKTQK
jgi:hypothetical protein